MNLENFAESKTEDKASCIAWLDDPALQSKYKVPDWVKQARPAIDENFGKVLQGPSGFSQDGFYPFDFEMDPGFSGGREKIAANYRAKAIVEYRLLQGDSYAAARSAAGLKGPGYPEEENAIRVQAKYEQALREGKGYQEARLAAGMSRDCDPGIAGGEERIGWHDRAYAWLKEFLRQGMSLTEAESRALTRIGPMPKWR